MISPDPGEITFKFSNSKDHPQHESVRVGHTSPTFSESEPFSSPVSSGSEMLVALNNVLPFALFQNIISTMMIGDPKVDLEFLRLKHLRERSLCEFCFGKRDTFFMACFEELENSL